MTLDSPPPALSITSASDSILWRKIFSVSSLFLELLRLLLQTLRQRLLKRPVRENLQLFQRPYVQPVRQTIRRLVLLQPPRCLNTDQKPYGRSTSDNLFNGLMYSLTYSLNSSGTGVFCFCSRWANYSARAPGSRHIQPRAMLHVPHAMLCVPSRHVTNPS